MELRIVGCHGGETPRHRTSAFVVDDRIAIDAGSLTSGLELKAQCALEAVLVSHAHLDHIRDLATIADNRVQNGCKPLLIAGARPTLGLLRKHFFNDKLWPDFSVIPSPEKPTIRYLEIKPGVVTDIAGYRVRAIPVSHTIDCFAFIVEGQKGGALAYSGDTGPTDRLWEVLNDVPDLRAMLMEVSFPNAEQRIATLSGHHTPQTLLTDLKKLHRHKELPFLLYHIKPSFQATVERECAKLKGCDLTIVNLGDQFVL
ncbi:MAG: 3',5'-cyclic-nucleotide phosphodiesterase [Myxococcales bacterium]|nr:3',5'-cyclic-nucleotide phosphodiesterase [Myxococcales bacterium]